MQCIPSDAVLIRKGIITRSYYPKVKNNLYEGLYGA